MAYNMSRYDFFFEKFKITEKKNSFSFFFLYLKVQEIRTGPIKNMAIYSNYYTQLDSSDLLMVHHCDQIRFYRLFGLEGIRPVLEIPIANNVYHAGFTPNPNWYLYLYHGNDCRSVKKMEILTPIYRNNRPSFEYYGQYRRNQSMF